jgi:hypothetical protein
MREPITRGTHYDQDPTLLVEEIEAHYEGKNGPGALPLTKETKHVIGIIAPNSPYRNCGDCMAWAYKELAETPIPDVYVIIGTNQQSQESGVSLNTFNTPLGFCRVDQELANALVAKGNIGVNEGIHARDFVLEVQLPFLIHAKRWEQERIKILPLLINRDVDTARLAKDIIDTLAEKKRTAIFIVSSCFTHYGPLFHYVPFTIDVEKGIKELDKGAIDRIIAADPEGFLAYRNEKLLNYHGATAIELLLRILRGIGGSIGCLEQYYTSGDILADYKNAVAYAAIVFEKNGAK